ncbi:Satratoxin biosynthesis SC1 cluster protein 4 [Fusarium oxysporum f. sp. albedinis]|nr:Satratoxin biosynthesis SC1 cluster protein 4 [Fusarium oxysporum f. sp. albedinis]
MTYHETRGNKARINQQSRHVSPRFQVITNKTRYRYTTTYYWSISKFVSRVPETPCRQQGFSRRSRQNKG